MPREPEPYVRHVTVEFCGGPLDGWSSGQMTDARLDFREVLYTEGGQYELELRSLHHFVYRWVEG